MRRAVAILALLAIIAVAAFAVPPSGSVFPGALDDFQAVAKLDRWTAEHHNRLLDAVNKVQQSIALSGLEETACASFSVNPAQRKLINIPLAQSTEGNEPVFGGVRDDSSPARVVFDDIEQLAGPIAQVWVFNRDASNARSGSVCVQVVRGLS